MLSLIKNGVLYEVSEQAPSPSKDFVNMLITTDEFIWRYWKINPQCLRSDVHISPSETRANHADFLADFDIQTDVKRVFGEKTLEYVKELCDGNFDYFPRLSKTLQIYIISFVDLEDIGKLAQSCKHFRELCASEQLWEHIVERHCDTITSDMRLYAGEVGWKQLFFTNKLQLQAKMRRYNEQRALIHEGSRVSAS